MELKDLKKLSGLNECGMSPMPSQPSTPASLSVSAASGSELSGMLKDLMSLAGLQKVEPSHLGVEPAPMKLLPEPVKAVGPAASDGEVMRGISDKLNLDKDDEKKADEGWDNEPASPEPEEAFDANQYAHHENPPGAAKGRNFKNNPVANVEDIAEQLFADYQNFISEEVVETANEMEESSEEMDEAKKPDHNFTADDIKELEKIEDLDTLKSQAFELISKPSAKPMKPEKVEWFKRRLESLPTIYSVIKLMYDLLLSGEGQSVIGSRGSMSGNSYRNRFGESEQDMDEEKSWFDMDSKERQAHYYKKGGGKPQPGHGAAPAKTSKGDVMRTAKDVKAHTGKSEYKGKEDDY
jgi:hypothetical protein